MGFQLWRANLVIALIVVKFLAVSFEKQVSSWMTCVFCHSTSLPGGWTVRWPIGHLTGSNRHLHSPTLIWHMANFTEGGEWPYNFFFWQTFFWKIGLWNFQKKSVSIDEYPGEMHTIFFLKLTCWNWQKQRRTFNSKHFFKIWGAFGCNLKSFRNMNRYFG